MKSTMRAWARGAIGGIRRRLSSESGFTLIEMATASAAMLLVVVPVTAVMLTSFRQDTSQHERVVSLDEARNGVLRITSEVRSAVELNSVHSQVLDVRVAVPGDTTNPYHWIRFKCAGNDQGASQGIGGTCTRQDKTLNPGADCTADGTGDGCTVLIRRVVKYSESDAFDEPCDNYDPATTAEKHFCLHDNRTVQFSVFVDVPDAEHPIEVRSAVTVRNCLASGVPVSCV